MLATKFRYLFNETIKLLQYRRLSRFEGESAGEWMGRLCEAVVECNYREIDQQLKEEFIHGLNDKIMLDEVIRELTTKRNNVHKQLVRMYWHGPTELKCSGNRQPY